MSPARITFSERGKVQGARFLALAGKVYEIAEEKELGGDRPTEWFLLDIRD